MQQPSNGSRNLSYPILCAFFLALLAFTGTQAQVDPNYKTDTGTGGRNLLQGDIYLPGGKRFDRAVTVKLGTPRGQIYTTSNGNGSFLFRGLHGGRYTVTVDAGETFEPATESVEMVDTSGGQNRPGQTFLVQIYLREKKGAVTGRGSVVSAPAPPEANELFDKAIAAVKNGQRDQAIEHLKAAIKIHPSFVAALNGLAVQYMRMGDYQKATEALSSALKFAPESFTLHLNQGIALVHLRRSADAETVLTRGIEKNPNSGPAHFYRARAWIGLKRLDLAEKDLRRALAIGGPDVVSAHRYLAGVCLERGATAEAVTHLEEYLKLARNTNEAEQIGALVQQLKQKNQTQR